MSATERLDQWAALADAATDGPWEWAGDSPDGVEPPVCPHGSEWTDHGPDLVTVEKRPPYPDGSVSPAEHIITSGGHDASWLTINEPDAAFIAASREAVPALIAALRAALDLLDERDEETAEVYGESEVATSSLVTTHEVRDAITSALDPA